MRIQLTPMVTRLSVNSWTRPEFRVLGEVATSDWCPNDKLIAASSNCKRLSRSQTEIITHTSQSSNKLSLHNRIVPTLRLVNLAFCYPVVPMCPLRCLSDLFPSNVQSCRLFWHPQSSVNESRAKIKQPIRVSFVSQLLDSFRDSKC